MDYLHNNGFKTISTKEFYLWYKGQIDFFGKTIMITIDDGNYEDYYLVYPIIKKYNFKATSFIIGNKIKNRTAKYNKYKTNYIGKDVINSIRKEYPNYEFQSHSFNMHSKLKRKAKLYYMDNKEILEDIIKNKKFNFSCIAYPFGYYNKVIQDFLDKNNYSIAFAFGPNKFASRDSERFLIPRIGVKSFFDLKLLKNWLIY